MDLMDKIHCGILEKLPLADGSKCQQGTMFVDRGSNRFSVGQETLLRGSLTAWSGVAINKIDPQATAKQKQNADLSAQFKGADRWLIAEIGYIKAMCAYLSPVLSDSQVQRAIADTESAKQAKDAITTIGTLGSAGASLGTLIPGVGTVLGAAGGVIAGAALAAIEAITSGQSLQEKKAALRKYLSGFLLNNPPVSTVALMASRARIPGGYPDVMMQMQGILLRSQTLQDLYPTQWAAVPAFPWKVEGVGVVSSTQVFNLMWTAKERSVGIWPTVEPPLLLWSNQATGDTPECSNAQARQINKIGQAWYTLDLGGLFSGLIPYIKADGKIANEALAKLGPSLYWRNQYAGRAVGSQAGVILAEIPCTSAVSLDLKALSQWGKNL